MAGRHPGGAAALSLQPERIFHRDCHSAVLPQWNGAVNGACIWYSGRTAAVFSKPILGSCRRLAFSALLLCDGAGAGKHNAGYTRYIHRSKHVICGDHAAVRVPVSTGVFAGLPAGRSGIFPVNLFASSPAGSPANR
ncbi:hypothetical protein D3C81_1603660 [compost metagenome]